LGGNIHSLTVSNNIEALLHTSKKVSLDVKVEKTKYTLMLRHKKARQELQCENKQ